MRLVGVGVVDELERFVVETLLEVSKAIFFA